MKACYVHFARDGGPFLTVLYRSMRAARRAAREARLSGERVTLQLWSPDDL